MPFHAWITTRLPDQRHDALDVGCGRGELLATLAEHFDSGRGIDADVEMQQAATARWARGSRHCRGFDCWIVHCAVVCQRVFGDTTGCGGFI